MNAEPLPDDEREDLVSYLDNEADAKTRRDVEAKLNRDPKLRAEAETMKRTWALLDHLPRAEPSPTFTTATVDKLSALRPPPSAATVDLPRIRIDPWLQRAAWAAVLFAAFAIGFLSTGGQPQSASPIKLDDPVLVQDLRIVSNLPLYEPVETYDFVVTLDDPELFGPDAVMP